MYGIPDSPRPHSAIIRKADPTDAPLIRDIALECGIDAWTAEQYRDEIDRNDSVIYVAIEGSGPVGFISGRLVPSTSDGVDGEIYNVAVIPASRGKKIGVELLRNVIEEFVLSLCKAVWLEVRKSNHHAIQFYENSGFTRVTIRRNFYSAPVEDAIVMRLTLVDPTSLNASPKT